MACASHAESWIQRWWLSAGRGLPGCFARRFGCTAALTLVSCVLFWYHRHGNCQRGHAAVEALPGFKLLQQSTWSS